MATSGAAKVEEYLAELPPQRAAVVQRVRQAILDHLPAGYDETMNWGMISYELPLARYPDTHNGQPLAVAALAAQRRHYSVYLYGCYSDRAVFDQLRGDYEAAGMKLDMGKSCLRFTSLARVNLDAVGRAVEAVPPDRLIALYEQARA